MHGFGKARKSRVAVPPEYKGDPIQLTAKVIGLQPGVQGAGANVRALVNPGKESIEIYGIKFRLRSTLPVGGQVIGCRLDLGDFPLTNGFVPVYNFGKAENLVAEQPAGLGSGSAFFNANIPAEFYAEYIINLARPILLPSGAAIRPQFQHRGQTTAAVDVHVTVFGRKLPMNAELPQKLWLPYWAIYNGKSFTLGAVDSDQSSESDLYNPFDMPMHMERFIGRIGYNASSTLYATQGATGDWEAAKFLQLQPSLNAQVTLADALGQVTCAITDSHGAPIVKRQTPFRLVFEQFTRSWPVSHELAPGAYYLVSLANAAWISADPTAAVGKVYAQPSISMLGWREVQ